MPSLNELEPRTETGFRVVVETPRGSAVKLKYDAELGAFELSRALALGVRYPYDWGFVPGTKAPDGDPLDAMVMIEAATYPGTVVDCVPVGVVEVDQAGKRGKRQRNDRLIAVPSRRKRARELQHVLPSAAERRELEQFFVNAVFLEGKDVKILGWSGRKQAEALLEKSIRAARGG
jgi:inorganic pyrophosphatase